ncbi:MAG TPA: hypothetical protein VG936_15295 [Lacunisphaera sp.]|nr:hypothetical protein [Lacunisphaera sp.]
MKKLLLGLLIGAALGATVSWMISRERAADSDRETAATPAPAGTKLPVAGLEFALPTRTMLPREVRGFGRVLDPTPFLTALADVETARISANASGREFARIKQLHEGNFNASGQALEAAEAAHKRDQVQLAVVQARLRSAWGPALAGQRDAPALARDLAAGSVALVRIDLPPEVNPAAPPSGARVAPLAEDGILRDIELVGAAPAVDPQAQGRGYLALWRGTPPPQGTELRAVLVLPGEPTAALVLPRGAFVRHQGAVFIYVQTSPGAAPVRRLVTLGPGVDAGLVVTEGVKPEERVVVTGAQQLLAAELLGNAEESGD